MMILHGWFLIILGMLVICNIINYFQLMIYSMRNCNISILIVSIISLIVSILLCNKLIPIILFKMDILLYILSLIFYGLGFSISIDIGDTIYCEYEEDDNDDDDE